MAKVQCSCRLGLGTIGIDPCVQFHTTTVTLVNHPLQRVPHRRRSLSLLAGEESAPRFDVALVQRVALGAHLEENGIDTILLQLVELIAERLLHLLRRHTDELTIYTLNPSSAKLSFAWIVRVGISINCGTDYHQHHHKDFCSHLD